jgi:hypothetical protein
MSMKLFGIVDTAESNFLSIGLFGDFPAHVSWQCSYRSSGDKVGLGRGWVWQFIVPSGLKSQEFTASVKNLVVCFCLKNYLLLNVRTFKKH